MNGVGREGQRSGAAGVGLSIRPEDPLNLANPPASDLLPPNPTTPAVGRGFQRS